MYALLKIPDASGNIHASGIIVLIHHRHSPRQYRRERDPREVWYLQQRGGAAAFAEAEQHNDYRYPEEEYARNGGVEEPQPEKYQRPEYRKEKLPQIDAAGAAAQRLFGVRIGRHPRGNAHQDEQYRPHYREDPRGRQERRRAYFGEYLAAVGRGQRAERPGCKAEHQLERQRTSRSRALGTRGGFGVGHIVSSFFSNRLTENFRLRIGSVFRVLPSFALCDIICLK